MRIQMMRERDEADLERAEKPVDEVESRVVLSLLETAHVTACHAGLESELFLRNPGLLAELPESPGEGAVNLRAPRRLHTSPTSQVAPVITTLSCSTLYNATYATAGCAPSSGYTFFDYLSGRIWGIFSRYAIEPMMRTNLRGSPIDRFLMASSRIDPQPNFHEGIDNGVLRGRDHRQGVTVRPRQRPDSFSMAPPQRMQAYHPNMLHRHPITNRWEYTNPQNPEFPPSLAEKAINIALAGIWCHTHDDLGAAAPIVVPAAICKRRRTPFRFTCMDRGMKRQPMMIGEMGGQR